MAAKHDSARVCDEGEDLAEELTGLKLTRSQEGGFLYSYRMDIPEVFYKHIIGRHGRTKDAIERDARCRIKIPKRGRTGCVVIEGHTERSVADAKHRLETVVQDNRLREPVNHFISIPLNHPTLMKSMETFQKEVLSKCSKDEGICEDAFQIPEKFHITIGVLRLFSREEEEKAIRVMKECLKQSVVHLGSEPAVVLVQGLDCMNDDHSAASVLFAKIRLTDYSDRLQRFVDTLAQHFREKAPDLMTKEPGRDTVKLHATVMNARFLSTSSYVRKTLDATNVVKEFGEFEFGKVPLEVVHLSKMGEKGPDGFYKCIDKFQLSNFLMK